MRHSETAHTSIMNIARRVPQMLVPDDIDRISTEWHLYENEAIPDEWFKKSNGYHPIDYYWQRVFTLKTNTGANQFIALAKLVKCALALSHGNADVERGFSENAFLLSDDRSLLSVASINGLRATRDGIKFFGNGKPHEVPITRDLLDSVRNAHSRYTLDLERQQRAMPVRERDDDDDDEESLLVDKANDLFDEQESLHASLSNVQKLIDEGTERLAQAISQKNFEDLETAQLLIQGGNRRLATTNTQMLENQSQLNHLRKKQKTSHT